MTLAGKKIGILVENFYEDLEVWYPYYRLKEEGGEVIFIGVEKDSEYKGKYGYPLKADIGISQANSEHFDALIIPGGYAPDHMRRTPSMIEFVRNLAQNGKIVASICHGGWMLASAHIIKGKKVTSFFAIKDDLVNAGAQFLDQEVVRDGNIITSRKPSDLPAFCRTIIQALSQ